MLTGVAGAPTEYFDAEQASAFSRLWGTTDLDEYLAELRSRKTGPNGVLGVKVHFDQMVEFLGDREFTEAFPDLRIVHIRRADIIAQAVSYATAAQTGQWASTHEAMRGARYRRIEVTRALEQIRNDERRWSAWFEERALDVIHVEYGDVVADPEGTIDRVLSHLDVGQQPRHDLSPTLRRQRNLRSRWWAHRYRLETVLRPPSEAH